MNKAALIEELARPEIRSLQAYASARSGGPPPASALLLNANELPWATDDGLELNRYPVPQPEPICKRLTELYGVGTNSLLLTRGSDEGIDILIRIFCRAYRDRIVICPPCFGMYEVWAKIQGAQVERVPLIQNDGSVISMVNRQAIVDSKARLVFLCSPNNPTGAIIPALDVLELAAALSGQALLVVDEAYGEFSTAPSMIEHLEAVPNLAILRTMSKAWGLAGARLGVLIARPEIVALAAKIIAPYPIPRPTVDVVLASLSPAGVRRMRRRIALIRQERRRLYEALQHVPIIKQVYPSEANFLLVRAQNAQDLLAAARGAGILLRDQSAQPELADCIRITIGTRRENDRLLTFLGNLQ